VAMLMWKMIGMNLRVTKFFDDEHSKGKKIKDLIFIMAEII